MANQQNLNFDTSLKLFIRSAENSKRFALVCAHFAIQHFKNHGDLSLAQRLVETLESTGKNYLRWRAFAAWMMLYTPCTFDKGKFKKDVERAQKEGDAAFQMDKALAIPFWDAVPDREDFEMFADNDIIVAFDRLVKKFQNTKRMKPTDALAIARLDRLTRLGEQLKAPILVPGQPETAAETLDEIAIEQVA